MKVISAIEDEEVIKKILMHLGLWDRKARPPPKVNVHPPPEGPTPNVQHVDYVYFYKSRMDSQLPPSEEYLYIDEDYPLEDYTFRRSRFRWG